MLAELVVHGVAELVAGDVAVRAVHAPVTGLEEVQGVFVRVEERVADVVDVHVGRQALQPVVVRLEEVRDEGVGVADPLEGADLGPLLLGLGVEGEVVAGLRVAVRGEPASLMIVQKGPRSWC